MCLLALRLKVGYFMDYGVIDESGLRLRVSLLLLLTCVVLR